MTDPVLDHLETERDRILERLLDFVRIPSVSTDPAYADGMAEARELLRLRLVGMGLSGVRLLDGGGHPAVFGECRAGDDRPTLLVYGHYDVQPPDPLDAWETPPFEPAIRDGRIYGRGVSDDKGPSSIALESMAAYLRVEGTLPVNVKVLLEGEEELGSPTLPDLIRRHRDTLESDAVLSADGASWRPDLTTVNVASRGNAGFEFTVRTASKDLHSGRYGGAVPNALHVLATLIAGLHTSDGRVAVPGFSQGVRDPSPDESEALRSIPFDETAMFESLGVEPVGEPGYSTLERLWVRPCLDVNGMWGGYLGAGGKTVIPHEAHAKITIRVVPGQDPEAVIDLVKEYLVDQCPSGAVVVCGADRGHSAAYELSPDHPLLQVVESALETAHGTRPHRVRIGGTLPVSDIVRRELGIDTVMLSYSIADEDFHAPNEFFRLSSLDLGLRAWTAVWRQLARVDRVGFRKIREDPPS